MSSFLTDAEKAALVADFRCVFDTFARPLRVYQQPQRTVVVSNPDYNPFTSNDQNSLDVQYTPVFSTITGTILWDKRQEWKFMTPGVEAQIKLSDQDAQACRLKVDATGYALLVSAEKVEIDGVQMTPASEPRPHGLFAPDRWTFYFNRSP